MKQNKLLWTASVLCAVFMGCTENDDGDNSYTNTSICGNGVLETGEICDDGNTRDGDGCSSVCYRETGYECPMAGSSCIKTGGKCGDGVLDPGEQCDDGNRREGDGCSSICEKEGVPIIVPPEQTTHCGNGTTEPNLGEACDDYNTDDLDGCSHDCQVEDGWTCNGGECWLPGCGNSVVEAGEACDFMLGNRGEYGLAEDGSFLCTTKCEYAPYCGDGIQNGPEACDLGVANNRSEYGDGCMSDCTKPPFCGDGFFSQGFEQCDPTTTQAGSGCEATCTPKAGWLCSAIDGSCQQKSTIACDGNAIDVGEECDQSGNGCKNCHAQSGYKCIRSEKSCTECSMISGKQCQLIAYGNGELDIDGYEECDDGNTRNGDGCSSVGKIESGYICPTPGRACRKVVHGDGYVDKEGGEECDDGNTKNGDGCASNGEIEAGYYCPTPGKPCVASACGDGIVAGSEECDDGNRSNDDGCSARCKVEEGYYCQTNPLINKSDCKKDTCGNSHVGHGEICDDGNTRNGDGCSSDCKTVEAGYRCLATGGKCEEEKCGKSGWFGDGKLNDNDPDYVGETCDDNNTRDGDGCSSICRIEEGYHCTTNASGKSSCTKGTCGDGFLDKGEQCDDHNNRGGDGCDPNCEIENGFECYNNECMPICGDGITMWMIGEECDDGNLTNGDGCSSKCKKEDGFVCTKFSTSYPETINLPVTFRDFNGRNLNIISGGGILTEEVVREIKSKDTTYCGRSATKEPVNANVAVKKNEEYLKAGYGHPDFQGFAGNLCLGIVNEDLGSDGKPVFSGNMSASCCGSKSDSQCKADHGTGTNSPINKTIADHLLCGPSFDTWFRTDSRINQEIPGHILLARTDATKGIYVFDSDNPPAAATNMSGNPFIKGYFNPLDNVGFGNNSTAKVNGTSYRINGNFTTEIATYFQYKGGETLNFTGDDDVWVFINGKLFVDLGGMHARQVGENTLSSSTCSNGQICDEHYGLYENGIYEMRIFQTEREASASNFKLTLAGFLNAGTSSCSSICGDGVTAGNEQCDIGNVSSNEATLRGCINCQLNPICGNGIVEAGESCDNGFMCNDSKYKSLCKSLGLSYNPKAECDDSCIFGQCNDGILQSWEECDCKGSNCQFAPGFDKYSSNCLRTCKVSICGDGFVDFTKGEECDDANKNENDACTTNCKAPKCGDGIVSEYLGEVCDDGVNDGKYGGCLPGCSARAPYCGDGKVQAVHGEECDDGINDGKYGGCTDKCKHAPYCGDGITNGNEQCDGTPNCSANCQFADN